MTSMYRSSFSYLQMQSGPELGLKSFLIQNVVYGCGVCLYCLLRRIMWNYCLLRRNSLFILTVTRRGICEDLFLTHTGSGTAIDPKDDLETRIITVLDQIQDRRHRQNTCSARTAALLYIEVVPFQSALSYMARYCHHLLHPWSVTLQNKINRNSFTSQAIFEHKLHSSRRSQKIQKDNDLMGHSRDGIMRLQLENVKY